ncbi:Armadillo-type fold [Phytophthora cactorum]|nr:Armadillo-type fold [Phytophthora cactorum]
MAPKKNKQREKQEQSRASSSARAHQSLLSSAGSNAAPPAFIGFASFAQPAPNAVQATPKTGAFYAKPVVQSIYDGSDHEIALALKMLAKKGAVTKIKALQTFFTDVLPPRQPTEIRPMLGHFTQLYTFEMRDQNDRKVRQMLNEVLAALADKMRPRAFVPHLQRLLPYWYLAMHDVNADVAAVANKAFNTLFPETEMRKTVLEEHLPAIMEEFQSFFTKTPDTFEGIPMQPDEKEERYERCVSAAVLSIDAVVKFLNSQEMTDKLKDHDAICSVATVVSSDKFTRLATASSKHPNFSRDIVRRAVYVLLVTLCTNAKSIIAAREESFGKVVLGILGDKSPANHEAMWNAVLTFLHTFPNIRHGFYGSGRSSFPSLLPFLSLVPLNVAVDPCWKFIESKDARFCEPPAITAFFECITGFFGIFLKESANAAWLSEQDVEPFEANYVNQFEKVFVSSLTMTLGSPEFPEGEVGLFTSSMLKLNSRLRSFSSDSAVINSLKDGFTEKLHTWTRQAISSMVSKISFVPSRVNTLMSAGITDARDRNEDLEAAQWLLTSKELYGQCLDQVDILVVEPTFSSAKNSSIAQLLEAIHGVCQAQPLDLLVLSGTDTPVETHFDGHYRLVLRVLSEWKRSAGSKSVDKTMRVALKLTRPFFLAAKEKKQFLLQLFQDCDVQFGDMAEASDIIQYGLQFPITEQGNKLWLSCGSWQSRYESGVSVNDESDPVLQGLQAIWQGKLLDEFLMISLKGRLDDLDASAFANLLKACLGSLSSSPVVSSDAVVILCHFVIQNGADSSDAVVVQILTQLCELFFKLNGELPAELEAVEGQLYKQLFHLSARGSYRAEASALWVRTVRHSLKKWSSTRTETFVNELAGHVNGFLLAELPAGSVSFNTKLFAAYVKSYVQLGADQAFFSVSQLVEKLDAINLRCKEDSQKKLFYGRVLSGLGEVCEDEQVIEALQVYFTSLASDNGEKAVNLVAKLVDLDVTHALTWVVFHSDDHIQRGVDLVEIMESYLTLEHLYEALKCLLGKHKRDSGEHRDLVFLSKNQSAVTTQNNGDWKTETTQTVAVSLFSTMYSENEAKDEVVAALKGFFALCHRDAVAKPAIGLFEYLRLVTRGIKEEDKLSSISKLEVINRSTQECIIAQLVEMLAPSSPTVVEVDQWVAVAEYVGALALYLPDATPEFRDRWEKLAHPEAQLKSGDRRIIKGDEEQIVLDTLTSSHARLALMDLVTAMYESNPDALHELAAHYREALLSTRVPDEGKYRNHVRGGSVSIAVLPACESLVQHRKVLASALPALRSTLTSIHDVDHVNRLVLESFGGIETLASLFNGKRYPLQPVLRVLLYILASADPKALRSALRAVFTDKTGGKSAANIRMRSRKQKLQEREDITGKLLLWDLFLQLFPLSGSESSSEGEGPSSTLIASSLSAYSASKIAALELQDTALFDVTDLDKKEDDEMWSLHKTRVFQLGTRVFFRTVVRLPAMVRSWWNDDCSRSTRSWAAKYFEDHITPSVLAAELELIQKAGESTSTAESWDDEEMTVKGSRVSREITTTYMKDECALEMVVRVPSSYPLRCVEVECTKRIGISEDRWRRWVLQIIRVTSSRDGSLLDAVLLWKHNVDKEFEGVEPCPICYSILNPKNMGLPSLPCKTCNNKYHNSCLYKWFNQSGKNKCPICQQPFC